MANILIDSSNVLEVVGVVDGISGTPITTATVLASLFNDADGSSIGGETWPVTLVHTSGGTYQYTLSEGLSLVPCVVCRTEFSIDDGAGFKKEWNALYPAIYDTLSVNIFIDNTDHVLTVDGLEDALSPGTYLNSATVTVTLTTVSGGNIAGETWPLTLGYVAASNGKYRATLRDTLDIKDGDAVKMLVVADDGAGYHREWRSILTVQTGV